MLSVLWQVDCCCRYILQCTSNFVVWQRLEMKLLLFFFLPKIAKYASGKYDFRVSMSLLDIQAMQFSTPSKGNCFWLPWILEVVNYLYPSFSSLSIYPSLPPTSALSPTLFPPFFLFRLQTWHLHSEYHRWRSKLLYCVNTYLSTVSFTLPDLCSPQTYYCNCDKREERNRLLKCIQHACEDLRHLEKARIRTLGSTLHSAFSDDEEVPGSLTGSHEFLNTLTMSSSMQVGRQDQCVCFGCHAPLTFVMSMHVCVCWYTCRSYASGVNWICVFSQDIDTVDLLLNT